MIDPFESLKQSFDLISNYPLLIVLPSDLMLFSVLRGLSADSFGLWTYVTHHHDYYLNNGTRLYRGIQLSRDVSQHETNRSTKTIGSGDNELDTGTTKY